jgi:hypothetical protein
MTKFPIICGILIVSACSSTPIEPPIGQPVCDSPIPITETIWRDINMLQDAISYNSLVDGECIEKLRRRIELHDENL